MNILTLNVEGRVREALIALSEMFALHSISLPHPETQEIYLWTAEGEDARLPAADFDWDLLFSKYNGVQFWFGGARDVYVGVQESSLDLMLDAMGDEEIRTLLFCAYKAGFPVKGIAGSMVVQPEE